MGSLHCGPPPPPPASGWSVVFENLPGALLSVAGTSATDVWAVGGDAGDGNGPLVLRFDGTRWTRLSTGTTGDLWWVYPFAGGPVFMGGRAGTILRYEAGVFEVTPTPGTATVFGIWGSSPTDVWAVGGNEGGASGAFAWRFDGLAWTDAAGFPAALTTSDAMWKVWGASANDVWIVGTRGHVVHFDGATIAEEPSGSARPLFTVHAGAGRFAAVGGFASGVVLENDGTGWADVTPAGALQLIGVCLADRGDDGYAVGINGTVMRRSAAGWIRESTDLDVYQALHSVWIDPSGGVWAVGGDVLSFPLIRGVMIHKGSAVPGGSF